MSSTRISTFDTLCAHTECETLIFFWIIKPAISSTFGWNHTLRLEFQSSQFLYKCRQPLHGHIIQEYPLYRWLVNGKKLGRRRISRSSHDSFSRITCSVPFKSSSNVFIKLQDFNLHELMWMRRIVVITAIHFTRTNKFWLAFFFIIVPSYVLARKMLCNVVTFLL